MNVRKIINEINYNKIKVEKSVYIKRKKEKKKEKGGKKESYEKRGRKKKVMGEGNGKYGGSVQGVPAFSIAG